jgi:pimeloyl-ACP methyl ester carboxylesterase
VTVLRVDVGGATLHVETSGATTGSRPALVLLHGFAASSFTWRHLVPPLATSHLVVTIDRLGFGGSDRVRGGDYSFAGSVAHTIAVLDHLGIERAIITGHSAGAGIAAGVALATAETGRVAGLCLIAPAIVAGGPPPGVRGVFGAPVVRQVAPFLLRGMAPFVGRSLRRTWAVAERVTPDIVDGYVRPLRTKGTAEALVEMTVAQPPPADLVDRLSTVRVPALVIAGVADRVVRAPDARRVADALSTDLVMIDDAGHLPHEEQPETTLAHVSRSRPRSYASWWEWSAR